MDWAAADPAALYLRPAGILHGDPAQAAIEAGDALKLGGGPAGFAFIELLRRHADMTVGRMLLPVPALRPWLEQAPRPVADRLERFLARLTGPLPDWAGFARDRPLVMGIVNVTPDSFSDGGDHLDPDRAIAHGRALRAAGADILDVGGESTRPGAEPVAPAVESARILPVIRALAGEGAVVSVDTSRTPVMAAALDAGARIVNDVSALRDTGALALAASRQVPVVLMHRQGEPATMQANPHYQYAPLDIFDWLEDRLAACEAAGLPRGLAMVDPGIGFGKTVSHNLEVLGRLGLLRATGCGIVVGVSRKRFIDRLAGIDVPPKERLGGSLALALGAADSGAGILRVHDVAATVQALRSWRAQLPFR